MSDIPALKTRASRIPQLSEACRQYNRKPFFFSSGHSKKETRMTNLPILLPSDAGTINNMLIFSPFIEIRGSEVRQYTLIHIGP